MARRNSSVLTAARWVLGTLFVIFMLVLFGVSDGNPVANTVVPAPGETIPTPAATDGTTAAAMAGAVAATP